MKYLTKEDSKTTIHLFQIILCFSYFFVFIKLIDKTNIRSVSAVDKTLAKKSWNYQTLPIPKRVVDKEKISKIEMILYPVSQKKNLELKPQQE